ncbi:MAG: hypothetical protein JXC32_00205 [Anaerolineae bacterium]|nr:hypothetical protein [Anaerolineae bacterium]
MALRRLAAVGSVYLFTFAVALALSPIVLAQDGQGSLTIDQLHMFLMPSEDRLLVTEHYLLSNSASEAYLGDDEDHVTVVFPLPAGAQNVQTDEGDESVGRYEIYEADGTLAIADTAPILPGSATTEVRFSYELVLETGLSVRRDMPLATESTVVLLTGDTWRLEGPQLLSFGEINAGGGTAQAYTLDPMSPGDAFTFSLEPATVSSDVGDARMSTAAEDNGLGLGIGVLSLVVAGTAVFALWRRNASRTSDRGLALPEALKDEVQALAELDKRFDAGELDAAAYEDQRRAVKARILGRLQHERRD